MIADERIWLLQLLRYHEYPHTELNRPSLSDRYNLFETTNSKPSVAIIWETKDPCHSSFPSNMVGCASLITEMALEKPDDKNDMLREPTSIGTITHTYLQQPNKIHGLLSREGGTQGWSAKERFLGSMELHYANWVLRRHGGFATILQPTKFGRQISQPSFPGVG